MTFQKTELKQIRVSGEWAHMSMIWYRKKKQMVDEDNKVFEHQR